MIAARRVREHSALFAALLCVCALLAGLGVGLVGHLDSAALDGVRAGIAQLSGTQAELRFDAPKSDDTAAQLRRANAIIARELRRGGAPVPVTVTHRDADDGDDIIWTVRADASRITPADLPVLARAGSAIHTAMLDDGTVGAQGVEKSGSLDSQARALAARVAPLASIQPVPLLLVTVIGLVTLAELARLLDGVRLRETALLRSRGASAVRVARTTALEALIVAGVGALLGAGIATGVLLALGEHPLDWSPLIAIVLAVVVAATVLVAGVAFNSARLAFRRDTVDDSGRARRLAAPGLLVLLVAAAALSLWRYLQFGSPLSPTSTGAAVDPIAVLAPALCLAALAVLCLAVFAPIARLVERLAARGEGAKLSLVAGQLARRPRMTASPIVLIALAGGGLVVAAAYTPTWQLAAGRTAALHAGADLVVTGAGPGDAAAIAKLPGVRAAAPTVTFSWQTDDGADVNLSALGASGLGHAISPADGAVDPAALARAVSGRLLGASIAAGATALDVTATSSGPMPTLAAYLVDADGIATRVPLAATTGTAPGHLHADLPTGAARRLVALDIDVPQQQPVTGAFDPQNPNTWVFTPEAVSFQVTAVTASGGDGDAQPVDLGAAWKPAGGESPGDPTPNGTLGFTGTASPGGYRLRYVPAGSQAVQVALSQPFAATTHARRGSELTLDLSGSVGGSLTTTVAQLAPALPGSSGANAVVADLAAVQTQRITSGGDPLPVDRVWVRSTSPRASAAAIEQALPGARVTGPAIAAGSGVLAAVPVALWLGMAGGVVLALIALAAVAGELLRLRADEVGVLRALGYAPRTLARLRQWELVAVCVGAAVGAALSGVIVSALTVPGLARIAIDAPFDALPQPLRLDPIGLGVAVLALAVAVWAIVAVYGAQVAQQARTAVPREGAR
ncbi:hypothetical protein GCM10022286_09000 [Gryllotalpicola daejeonensis]|uniref:ABC3 transporter permease C-terminal domain-containing protein n=1 Tax=Gryllotalpicola daejeonensis TaxID=993087 RepID=A0ABP7ZH28_9MICO